MRRGTFAILFLLYWVVMEGFTERILFEQRPEGSEGANQEQIRVIARGRVF